MPEPLTLALMVTVAAVLDTHSTVLALRAGHEEANPFLRRAMQRAPWRATALLWALLIGLWAATLGLLRAGLIAPGGAVQLNVFYLLTAVSLAKLLAAANNYLLALTGLSLPGALRRRLGHPRSRLLDFVVLLALFLPPTIWLTDRLFPAFHGMATVSDSAAGAGATAPGRGP